MTKELFCVMLEQIYYGQTKHLGKMYLFIHSYALWCIIVITVTCPITRTLS